MAEGTGLKIKDIYEAGWEIRIDDAPLEERIRGLFGGPVLQAMPEHRVKIARGDQVAIEFHMRKMEVDGASVHELIEAIERAKERADG
jgi:hypothetical protein